tara:strand:- start:701 stop:1147 length:447 start_codon:yes stop_codon:yes gene_type:complete
METFKNTKMNLDNILIKIPAIVLGLHAILNLFRGSMHFFLEDGGSEIIAGLDIGSGNQKQIIITIFASMGAGQIIWGILQFYILLYAKSLIATILTFTTILSGMGVYILYIFKPLPIIVPGHNNLYVLILLIIATLISYRNKTTKNYL